MQLLQLVKQQKANLLSKDASNLEAISHAYLVMYDRLQGDIDALTLAIEQLDNPTKSEVESLPQYKRLIRHANEELDRFTIYLETTIGAVALASIGQGIGDSRQLINLADPGFIGLNSSVIRPLLSYLSPDGPLYARLKLITDGTVSNVVQSIIDGVSQGFNPRKIASMIQDAFGGGLTDALRNTRTVQLYSYRDASRANYMASDGIVTGWVWYAELDGDTCEACAAEHGTIHPLDETLDGHYNCRCAAIPYIEGITGDIPSGEDWFNGLSPEEQAAFLGPGKYDAWQQGKFEFSQLSKTVDSQVYGTMT